MQLNSAASISSSDLLCAVLVGRVWHDAQINGSCIVVERNGDIVDIPSVFLTVADLLDGEDVLGVAHAKSDASGDMQSTESSGALVNHEQPRTAIPPRTFGVCALGQSLAARGLMNSLSTSGAAA